MTADNGQGINPNASIYGRVGSVGLNDILQLLGMASQTATVSIHCRDRNGRIFLKDGVVLHATAGKVAGESALLRLVNWPGAEFVIEDGIAEPVTPTISKKVDAVMLDVLTQADESKRSGVPLFTPFPPLDKLDFSPLESRDKHEEDEARPVPLKPPVPRKRSRSNLHGPLAVSVTVAVAAIVASLMAFQNLVEIDADALQSFPSVPLRRSETTADSGAANEVFRAASAQRRVDAIELLASHSVSLSAELTDRAATSVVPRQADVVPINATGQLLIVVDPWARILLDGRAVGETPLPAFDLAAGEHEIVLSNAGVVGVIRDTVNVEPGETLSVSYSFAKTGSVRILVTPWADVYVDGQHVGQTPMDELQIPVGRHSVSLRHPSLGERTEIVEVRGQELTILKIEM